ncbi:MAG: acyl-CoA desaturase, partial [Myxococcota bacterium]
FVHAGALLVLLTGASATALWVAFALFVLRAFGLTAGYHRYFAHRSFRTSRAFQFALAWLGASAAQLGPLWWAAHHRRHHRFADSEDDVHSPGLRGLLWAHIGWLLCRRYSATDFGAIRDFARYPELRWLDRFPIVPPLVLALALYAAGEALARSAPWLGTDGLQLLAWGFFASTVALYHTTFAVNSLGHRGTTSLNRAWLAALTLGDGWHANHHRFPASARHGFGAAQPDVTWLALRGLEGLGLVWELSAPPARVKQRTLARAGRWQAGAGQS